MVQGMGVRVSDLGVRGKGLWMSVVATWVRVREIASRRLWALDYSRGNIHPIQPHN